MDRDVGKASVEDGNGQLYFDINLLYPEKYNFYFTFFTDVLNLRTTFSGEDAANWFGVTIGGKTVDLYFNNLDLTIEYTRINPWVYEHKDDATTYKHLGYDLGHWIGQNSDQLRIQFDYQFIRGLHLSLFGERIRKGGLLQPTFEHAYQGNASKPFLYGDLREDLRIGIFGSYEYIHELFVKFSYFYSEIEDTHPSRTQNFLRGAKHNFSLSLSYGFD